MSSLTPRVSNTGSKNFVDLEIQKILANKCDQLIFQINETKAIKKKKLSQLNFLKSSILNQAFSGEFTKDVA